MAAYRPRFVFHNWEIVFHGAFVTLTAMVALYHMADYNLKNAPSSSTESFLSPIFGRLRDSHDEQWEAYRSNLCILVVTAVLWKISMGLLGININRYSSLLGAVMLIIAFRADIFLYLAVVVLWYIFTRQFSNNHFFIPASFVIMLTVLFLNEQFDHFRSISRFMEQFVPLDWFKNSHSAVHWAHILNMTFLKLLSYSFDMIRPEQSLQLSRHRLSCLECGDSIGETKKDEENGGDKIERLCLKGRNYFPVKDYSFSKYMGYILYAPTLLTGPPISYKNYYSFEQVPAKINLPIIRWILLLTSFEVFQHFYPVTPLRISNSLFEMELISLLHLIFIWYKFLIIWRTGKLWSALYGVDLVDNMGRCICNNYGFQGFWRMWHRGFNQWLVRYIYIPLGGNSTVPTMISSTVAVIAFVAFWHDHTLNIIYWAFLLVLCFVPEMLVKWYFRKFYGHLYSKQWFKYACAVLASLYIYLLVFANIIGFGYGLDKSYMLFEKIAEERWQLVWSYITVSSACILMFYLRDREDGGRNF